MTESPDRPLAGGPLHPILAAVAAVDESITSVAEVNPTFMSPDQKATALIELARQEARLAELKLRVLAVADDLADQSGARDVAAWVADKCRVDPGPARVEARLANSLDRSHLLHSHAVRDGAASIAQAQVITHVLDDLPGDLDPDTLALAEKAMVRYAGDYAPAQLRRLGRHLLDVVAPEIAEAADARRLAEIEAEAERKVRLSLRPVGDGTTRLSGRLPDADAIRLRVYLEAFTSPRAGCDLTGDRSEDPATPGSNPDVDRLPYAARLGHAFRALIEMIDPAKLPQHGGSTTTVMVTLSLEQLQQQLAAATILDDTTSMAPTSGGSMANLSASQARRLACNAAIIPVVLGGRSELLDLGRSARLFSTAQRRALRLRDTTCRAEGCTIPTTWTEAHHIDPWSHGGPTNLENAISLCSFHHHRVHDPGFETERVSNGDYRFIRRR